MVGRLPNLLGLHSAADELHADLTRLAAEIRFCVDRRPDRVYSGPCGAPTDAGACPGHLYAHIGGLVTCPACGAQHDVAERRAWMTEQALDMLVIAPVARWARLLMDHVIPPVPGARGCPGGASSPTAPTRSAGPSTASAMWSIWSPSTYGAGMPHDRGSLDGVTCGVEPPYRAHDDPVTVLATRSVQQRVAALRAGTGKPVGHRAAEELLIEHGTWLRREEFCATALDCPAEDLATIRWDRAGDMLAEALAGSTPAAEVVVLAFAVVLGTDRLQLSTMDEEGQRRVLAAVRSIVRDWTDEDDSSSLSAALWTAVGSRISSADDTSPLCLHGALTCAQQSTLNPGDV